MQRNHRSHLPSPPPGLSDSQPSAVSHHVDRGGIERWGDRTDIPGGGIFKPPPAGQFVSVSAGWRFACGLRPDDSVDCWDGDRGGRLTQYDLPPGEFSVVSSSRTHACALRTSGSVECWGENSEYQSSPASRVDPAHGFLDVVLGANSRCGLRGDGTIACWGGWRFWYGWKANGLEGEFAAIGYTPWGVCGLRSSGSIKCETPAPEARFRALDRSENACALGTDDAIVCWDLQTGAMVEEWSGQFDEIGGDCGLRPDGSIGCRPSASADHDDHSARWDWDTSAIPAGTFVAVDANRHVGCAVRTGGALICWTDDDQDGTTNPPRGTFTTVRVENRFNGGVGCALRNDKSITCCGYDGDGTTQPPSGAFTALALDGRHACAVRTDSTIACWGRASDFPWPPYWHKYAPY